MKIHHYGLTLKKMFKFSDIYETDGATCKTKMWRCFSRVAEGSLHYLSDPGGITGYVQGPRTQIDAFQTNNFS